MTMTTIANTSISMTSREIAELVNKEHFHVMRDIRAMMVELEIEQNPFLDFDNSGAKGRRVDFFRLNKDLTICLLGKYSAVVRYRVIKRLNEMEEENKMLTIGLVKVTQAETIEAAHGIAEEVLARRELLRNSYKTEVAQVLTASFENRTSGGGRNIGQVMMNHAKLISLVATGVTPCVFKKEHDDMNPRDWALATNDLELIDALSRAEAKVLALSEAGMSYTEIKAILIKD